MDSQDRNCVIVVGGSVAGLVAANRLVDLGLQVIVIEGSSYPAFRVCGEFLSPECLPHLAKWGVIPEKVIKRCQFFGNKSLEFSLQPGGGGMSRSLLEMKLLSRLQEGGGAVLTGTKVAGIEPPQTEGGPFRLSLSDGKVLEANQLIVAAGRIFSKTKPFCPYFGMKAHFQNIDLKETLEMHLFKGGYCGVSPIGPNTVNVAMLSKSRRTLPESLLSCLSPGEIQKPGWVRVEAPDFGVKQHPGWPNTYLVGDAAATIPPITGEGVGMAVTSGVMAADYAAKGDSKGYQNAWRHRYLSRIGWGMRLHQAAMSPVKSAFFMEICRAFPRLPGMIYRYTRENH